MAIEHPEVPNRYTFGGCLVSGILIIIGSIACLATAAGLVDQQCVSETDDWLHLYPNAQIVSEDYTFLRLFGIGESRRLQHTPDDDSSVRRWYMDTDAATSQELGRGRDGGQARMRVSIVSAPEGGTNIIQTSECAIEFDLSVYGIGRGG